MAPHKVKTTKCYFVANISFIVDPPSKPKIIRKMLCAKIRIIFVECFPWFTRFMLNHQFHHQPHRNEHEREFSCQQNLSLEKYAYFFIVNLEWNISISKEFPSLRSLYIKPSRPSGLLRTWGKRNCGKIDFIFRVLWWNSRRFLWT